MKYRSGFVSNSSTSSSVYVGYEFSEIETDIIEVGKKLFGDAEDFPKDVECVETVTKREFTCEHGDVDGIKKGKFCPQCGLPINITQEQVVDKDAFEDAVINYLYESKYNNSGVTLVLGDENYTSGKFFVGVHIIGFGEGDYFQSREFDASELTNQMNHIKSVLGLPEDVKGVVSCVISAC